MSVRSRNATLLVSMLALLLAGAARAAEPRSVPLVDELKDEGVTLAMTGETARAESVFVAMLSHSRGDPRALNNLGNLRLLRGDLGVALAFYDRAARGDSADAGILLNRAIALMLMGDDARARDAAGAGIGIAGGIDRAQALLGLRSEDEKVRADKQAFINRAEVRALLRQAAALVPSDTIRVVKPDPAASGKKKAPTWRSGATRSADQSDAAVVLYWKR